MKSSTIQAKINTLDIAYNMSELTDEEYNSQWKALHAKYVAKKEEEIAKNSADMEALINRFKKINSLTN